MRYLMGETTIGRPVETVFDLLAAGHGQPPCDPDLSPPSGPVRHGARTEHAVHQRPELLVVTTTTPAGTVCRTLRLEPVAGGTRLRWSWAIRPRGAFRLLAPFTMRLAGVRAHHVEADLRARLRETTPPVDAVR